MRRFTSAVRLLFAGALVISLACPASGFADPPVDDDEVVLRPDHIPEIDVAVGSSGEEYVAGEVIVKFKSGTSPVAARKAHGLADSPGAERLGAVPGLELARIASGKDVLETVRAYEAMPEVEYAQPNYIFRIAAAPDDALFPMQWGLHNTGQTGGVVDADIDAPEAWEIHTGSQSVIVAVVDTGIDYLHPDFGDNLWVNSDETPNGLDDDGNGFIDDIYGCDTFNDDGDPYDDNGHGTHVAGTIGAQGNNGLGVAGTDWDVSILSVKAGGGMWGIFTTSSILEAFAYIEETDARVINCSWGGAAYDAAQYSAIAGMPDRLFVCSAGNEGKDLEVSNSYPAGYDLPNILSVGASDASDARAVGSGWSSNIGATRVDVFAPGVDVVSTWPCPRRRVVASDAIVNTIFRDEFANLSAWVQAPVFPKAMHPWVTDGTHVVSAPYAAANIGYGNNQGTWLIAASPIDISLADVPGMRFHVRIDSAAGDYLRWGVYDVPTGMNIAFGSVSGDNKEIQEVAIDLAMFAGSTAVQPWVQFVSDSAVNSADGYGGVWVDDFEVFDIDVGPTGTPWGYEPWAAAYAISGGTSMAAPHAAGVAGLLLARNPALTNLDLKQAIMDGVDTPPALAGMCVTDGRLNAYGAIVAANRAPDVVDDAVTTPEDTDAVFNVLANDTDIEGDPVTVEITRSVTIGALALTPSGETTYTPPPDWTGTTSFAYRAFDGFAYSESVNATITVTPVNDAPVAADDAYGMVGGGRLTVPASSGVLINDSDIDTAAFSAMLVTPPGRGALTLRPDGGFTYTPAPGFSGTDTFTYAAHDGVAASAPALVTIRVAASPMTLSSSWADPTESVADAAQEATSAGQPPEAATVPVEPDEESVASDEVGGSGADEDEEADGTRFFLCGAIAALMLLLALGLLLALKRQRKQSEDVPEGDGAGPAQEPQL